MGLAAISLMKRKQLKIIVVLDKNAKQLPGEIEGVPVMHMDEVETTLLKDLTVVVCIAVCHFREIERELKNKGFKHIISCGKFVYELYPDRGFANLWKLESKQENIIKKNQSIFLDEDSKKYYYYGAFFFKNLEDHSKLKIYLPKEKYFPPEIKEVLKNDEIVLDTFWLNGEYINRYQELIGGFTHYYAFAVKRKETNKEETRITFSSLEFSSFQSLKKVIRFGVMQPYTEGEAEEIIFDFIDNQMIGKKYTFLRCYSMSPCLDIIKGGFDSIKANRPVLAVNIGHYKQDFLEIPSLLKENLKSYSWIYRQHGYYGCDSILYGIPKERLLKNENKVIKEVMD